MKEFFLWVLLKERKRAKKGQQGRKTNKKRNKI
jgi:hypothetical protein